VPKHVLTMDADQCDGCRLCEMMCSLVKTGGTISPVKARVRVVKIETLGIDVPMICYHCEDPPCKAVCPTAAIYRSGETDAVLVEESRCIGCRECMVACPFGAILFDESKGVVAKCDLCDGNPACVKICEQAHPPGVIHYIRSDMSEKDKRRRAMYKLQEAAIKSRTASKSSAS